MADLKDFLTSLINREGYITYLKSIYANIVNAKLYDSFYMFFKSLPDEVSDNDKRFFVSDFFTHNKIRPQDCEFLCTQKNFLTKTQIRNIGSGNLKNPLFDDVFLNDIKEKINDKFIYSKFIKELNKKKDRKTINNIGLFFEEEINRYSHLFDEKSFVSCLYKSDGSHGSSFKLMKALISKHPKNLKSLFELLNIDSKTYLSFLTVNSDWEIKSFLRSALSSEEGIVNFIDFLKDVSENKNKKYIADEVNKADYLLKQIRINGLDYALSEYWGLTVSNKEKLNSVKILLEHNIIKESDSILLLEEDKSKLNEFAFNVISKYVYEVKSKNPNDLTFDGFLEDLQEIILRDSLANRNTSKKIKV